MKVWKSWFCQKWPKMVKIANRSIHQSSFRLDRGYRKFEAFLETSSFFPVVGVKSPFLCVCLLSVCSLFFIWNLSLMEYSRILNGVVVELGLWQLCLGGDGCWIAFVGRNEINAELVIKFKLRGVKIFWKWLYWRLKF